VDLRWLVFTERDLVKISTRRENNVYINIKTKMFRSIYGHSQVYETLTCLKILVCFIESIADFRVCTLFSVVLKVK